MAEQLAPRRARIELVLRGDEAVGEVTASPVPMLPVHITARAVAVLEPGAALGAAAPEAGGEP